MQDGTRHDDEANDLKNEIAASFDIHVINSQLISKAKKLKISGSTVVTSAIEVQPIVLIKTIPKAAKLPYSYSAAKAEFGGNGKILPNITTLLCKNILMIAISATVDFSKQGQVGYTNKINAFKTLANTIKGSKEDILNAVSDTDIQSILDIPYICQISDTIKSSGIELPSQIDYALAALQLANIHANNKLDFKKAVEYAKYSVEKAAYIQIFQSLKETWKNITPKETKDGLVIEFPKANQISNGERDIICFVAQLKKAKLKFKKNKSILIIDEIFDYLDDANLVACHYYLTEMIFEIKSEGRQIFPLIMTHLNPGFFRNFTFSNRKVCYLNKISVIDKEVEKIIINRSKSSIADPISKYFLHFHNEDKDLTTEFQTLGLPTSLGKASLFTEHCKKHLNKYLGGESFDPLAVCCAVRRQIESSAYEMLTPTHQTEFLSTHKTVDKLEFAKSKGLNIPEKYFLLGVIYNDALHLKENQDNFSPLGSKLGNLTIKHMIKSL